jgi:hypothetical protein
LLILGLITVAVAATVVGATVATNTRIPPGANFGSARDMATFARSGPQATTAIAALRHHFGRVEVIEFDIVGTRLGPDLRPARRTRTGRLASPC